MVDEDSSHQLRCQGEKMTPILPPDRTLFDELQISFIYECRCVESMITPLTSELAARLPPKLLVNRSYQIV
jgi:hypothetical protein